MTDRPDNPLVDGVPLPPDDMVFMAKTAAEGYAKGLELVDTLSTIGADTRMGHILDVGCGWGRLAYGLLGRGFAGRYTGVDIQLHLTEFLSRNITPVHPGMTFHNWDFGNDRYNAGGTETAIDFAPFLKGRTPTDIVLLSVFTHMYEADIRLYLTALKQVMGPQTRLIFSTALISDSNRAAIDAGEAWFTIRHQISPHCRCQHKARPLVAIAYDKGWFLTLLDEFGFDVTLQPGNWGQPKDGDPSRHASGQRQDWLRCTLRPGG